MKIVGVCLASRSTGNKWNLGNTVAAGAVQVKVKQMPATLLVPFGVQVDSATQKILVSCSTSNSSKYTQIIYML